jgi:hypothetical protein
MAATGPELWAELHRWAMTANATDAAAATAWLVAFAAKLPCGTCRTHWLELVKATPPPTTTNEALFAWSYNLHDAVNVRIGKVSPTLAEARATP